MNEGWIGSWSPGIGDPTLAGWLTVALYAWAAWMCFRVLRRERLRRLFLSPNERLVWRLMFAGMIALGINKQLDLQSAFTEGARLLAMKQGWYDHRRQFQEAFVVAIPIVGLTALGALAVLVWHAPASTLWTCAGVAGLMVFIAIRASSFHHVDEMLNWHLAGFRLNWVLEMGSLLVIGLGARRRTRVRK